MWLTPFIIKSAFWENTELHAHYSWTRNQALLVTAFCVYILNSHNEMTTNQKSNIISSVILYIRSIPHVLWKEVPRPFFHFKLLQRPFERLTPVVLLPFSSFCLKKKENRAFLFFKVSSLTHSNSQKTSPKWLIYLLRHLPYPRL